MDYGIGRIMDALAANGLEKDTLVVFFSDNGGDPPYANNEPLRGHKAQLFEGGIRVPCIFRWPGRLEAGQVSDQPIITMDITATTLAAAGVKRDLAARAADGIDVLPILTGQKPQQPRRLFWFAKDRPPQLPFLRAIRDGDWKLVQINEQQHLFNLKDDPSEKQNLAVQYPAKVKELLRSYTDWEASLPPREDGGKP
jgi:arylsulfatase A-like enzyme